MMPRQEEILDLLKSRGEEGFSVKEIASSLGYKNRVSVNKAVWLVKKEGHDVYFDKSRKVYVLNGSKAHSPNRPDLTAATKKRRNFVKESIKELLQESSSSGGCTPKELAQAAGIKEKNVCYHIFSLRHKDNMKIVLNKGKYILKSRSNNSSVIVRPRTDVKSSTKEVNPINDNRSALEKELNDKRLLNGLSVIQSEDMDSYLDLLKKMVFYRRCAIGLLETTEMILEAKNNDL